MVSTRVHLLLRTHILLINLYDLELLTQWQSCPVTTQALDCNIHLCLYCGLFWGRGNAGVVNHCRHNRRMFRSTIWKWVELSDSLCNTLCCQSCLCILIPTLLNCLNQTSHSLCDKYRERTIYHSRKETGPIARASKFWSYSQTSPYGHISNTDTSLIWTVHLVLGKCPYILGKNSLSLYSTAQK